MKIKSPRYISALAIFPVPTSLNGVRMMKRGRVLKMQAHLGRSVAPVTTAMKNVTAKTRRPV